MRGSLARPRIRIAYDSRKGPVSRELDPLGLVLKAGLWYLVAAAEGKPRTYRVSNITALTVLETASGRPAKFDLERQLKTLKGLAPYEYVYKIWTKEPDRFGVNTTHQFPGLNIQG